MARQFLAVAALFGFLVAAGCGKEEGSDLEAEESETLVVPVSTRQVVPASFSTHIEATGKVRAKRDVTVVSRIGGEVLEVPVKEGDSVAKGDLLVRLDDEELRFRTREATAAVALARANLEKMGQLSRPQQIEQVKANLESARANFEKAQVDRQRSERLFQEGVIAKEALDSAVTRYTLAEASLRAVEEEYALVEEGAREEDRQMAQAQVEQAEAGLLLAEKQLSYCRIEAPIEGKVAAVFVQVGNTIAPGTPALNVVDLDTVEIEIGLTSEEIGFAREGEEVTVQAEALGEGSIPGVVTYSGIKADERTGVFPVLIEVANEEGRLRPGMVVVARLVRERFQDAVVVNHDVVVEKTPGWVVFVVEDGKAVERPIRGRTVGDEQILVLEGLRPGEELVVSGQNRLKDGAQVSVQRL